MSTTAIREVMDKTTQDLWKLWREVEGFSAQGILITYTPEAIATALSVAKEALGVLEGELRDWVLSDGGPHGSPARAWEVWQELAIDTGSNLNRALDFNEKYTLKGIAGTIGQTVEGTGKAIGAGISTLLDTIKWAAIAYVIFQVASALRRGRA